MSTQLQHEGYVFTADVPIYYKSIGEGPPLVLLHGVGHHWQAWRPVIERLRGSFDLIACDTPGFGQSAPLPSTMEPTITSHADAFEWFLAELGLERVAAWIAGRPGLAAPALIDQHEPIRPRETEQVREKILVV